VAEARVDLQRQRIDDAWRSALRLQGFLAGDGLQTPETTADGDQTATIAVGQGRAR
jgi:hypothetical protein